jgi:hypothetical protein
MTYISAIVLCACLLTTATAWPQAPTVSIRPHKNSRTADLSVRGYPRDTFSVDFPEVVHKDDQFLLGPEGGGFHDSDVKWRQVGSLAWLTTYTKLGVGKYSIWMEPHLDEIDMEWFVQNLSQEEWQYVGATADFFFAKAPDFIDPNLDRTYLRIGGKWVALKETDHSDGGWSTQWYVPKGYRPTKMMGTKPHRKDSFGLSQDEPDNGLVAVVSRDGQMVVGQAFSRVQYICLNSPHCVHPAVHLGDIPAGKEVSARGKFYFIRGSLDDLWQRYSRDFP